MMLKVGNLVFFAEVSILVIVLVATNCAKPAECQESCDCKSIFHMMYTINDKLDNEILKMPKCNPITGLKSIIVDEPKMILDGIGGPHGMLAKGNDLYIAGWKDGFVYRYNTQQGGSKPKRITARNTYNGKRMTLSFMELHDDILFITDTEGRALYEVSLDGRYARHNSPIAIDGSHPVGGNISPNGETFLISEKISGLIRVLDRLIPTTYKLVSTIDAKADCGKTLRELTFLSDDKFIVSTYGSSFCVFQRGSDGKFTHVKPNKMTSSPNIDGYYVHCDGTIIATDRKGGRLIQMDKDFNTIDTLSGFQSGIIDVAVTDDGTLAVSNSVKNTVKLYSLHAVTTKAGR